MNGSRDSGNIEQETGFQEKQTEDLCRAKPSVVEDFQGEAGDHLEHSLCIWF